MNSKTPDKARLLLVDDEPDLLHVVGLRLEVAGYAVETACSGAEALAKIPVFRPQLVISDLRMQGMDGMALFEAIVRKWPTLPVIIFTAHGTIPDAVEATQRGVFGYLTKPFDHKAMQARIEAALQLGGGVPDDAHESSALRKAVLTRNPELEATLARAERAAHSEARILVSGPSGVGKLHLARAIHLASPRRERPFRVVDCSAPPPERIENLLQEAQTAGAGTVCLLRVEHLSAPAQAVLLRWLQEDASATGIRIVATTACDLEEKAGQRAFREDLFYMLDQVELRLPALAERREDIPLLAGHFLDQLAKEAAVRVKGFSPEALQRLAAYDWPGNVRQLHSIVARTLALTATALIPASEVALALEDAPAELPSLVETREQAEREYLIRILTLTEGNVTAAARLAKRNRTEFYKLLNRHHLEPALFKNKA